MEQQFATSSLVIHAVPSRVFEAITDGDNVVYHKLGTVIKSSWEQGSSISFVDEHTGSTIRGMVTHNHAPLHLEYIQPLTDCEGTTAKETLVKFHLEPINMKTKVIVEQGDFSQFTNAPQLIAEANHHWQEFLHRLKRQLEAENRSFP
jgi:uncharacterized protein YndB with AHSA1/START domain